MSAKTGRFRRADRILRSREFKSVVRRGERFASGSFVVFVARAPEDPMSGDVDRIKGRQRLGITVSRKVGNAVVRNRVKRRVREWFRSARTQLPVDAEIVVIARRPARELSGTAVATTLRETMLRSIRVSRALPSEAL
jgi:ribonuclease P protein component